MQAIKKLEKMGYNINVNDGKINFDFINGSIPSIEEAERLISDIKNNETKVIDLLEQEEARANHREAIKGYYIPYGFNECYGKQLTQRSYVFIQRIDLTSLWTGYRLTYNERNDISTQKDTIEDTDFKKVLNRTERYVKNFLEYINKG